MKKLKFRIRQFSHCTTGGIAVGQVYRQSKGVSADRCPHLHIEMDYTIRRAKSFGTARQQSGKEFSENLEYTDNGEIVCITVALVDVRAVMSADTDWPPFADIWRDVAHIMLNMVKASEQELEPNRCRDLSIEAGALAA